MTQFGAGIDLAAQCPTATIPDGWRAWTDADGPVPDALAQRAQAIVADQSVTLGTTESYPLPGVTTLLRVEPRVWNRDPQGNLVQGCFRTVGIYLPADTPLATGSVTALSHDELNTTVEVLTAVSLVGGMIAAVAAWANRRKKRR